MCYVIYNIPVFLPALSFICYMYCLIVCIIFPALCVFYNILLWKRNGNKHGLVYGNVWK